TATSTPKRAECIDFAIAREAGAGFLLDFARLTYRIPSSFVNPGRLGGRMVKSRRRARLGKCWKSMAMINGAHTRAHRSIGPSAAAKRRRGARHKQTKSARAPSRGAAW